MHCPLRDERVTTTPLADRAGAMCKAIENVKGVGSVLNPIAEMEDVSAGRLPILVRSCRGG